MKLVKVIFEFFTEDVSALRVRDITLTTVLLIQLVCHSETNVLLFLEEEIVLLNKVIEHIGLHHHVLGLISVVVVLSKTPINPKTVICNLPKLISDLRHQGLVLVSPNGLPGGGDINQPTDNTRLRVGDLDRLVGTDEEKGIDSLRVALYTLLIDQDRLVGNNTVKQAISLDPREVSVLIDGHERTLAESACCKLI